MKTPAPFSFTRTLGLALLLSLSAVWQVAAGGPTPPTPAPLSVVIVAPTNGNFFAAPADINISANASDYGSYIHTASFYAGTNLLQTFILDPIGPSETNGQVINIQYNWTGVPAGAYTLTVVVSDTAGNTATSNPVNITVLTSVPPLPIVTIFATDPIAVEGTNFPPYTPSAATAAYIGGGTTNTATFLVHRTGAAATNLTVYYSIGGTASNGVDYVKIPGNVTIPAGKTYALITIVPIKQITPVALPEYRTVILTLTEPPTANLLPDPYIIGWPNKAEVIILERNRPIEPPIPILPVPPRIGPLADGSFNYTYTAANGMNYCLEVSTDLVNWTPVCTTTVVKGYLVFVDPESGGYPTRYYRAIPAMSTAAY